MARRCVWKWVAAVAWLGWGLSARADVRLPAVLADHMVLQQETAVTLWGWAFAGEEVVIETSWGIRTNAVADAEGAWKVKVRTPKAQPLRQGLHPESLSFTVPHQNMVQLKDVLIGELWLCSGQSNMAMLLGPDSPPGNNKWYGEAFWQAEAARAHRPGLRLFNVEKTGALTPQADCKGVMPDHVTLPKDSQGLTRELMRGWQACTPETATYFSAVAYYFGAELQDQLGVPVGLISSDLGGTTIQSWMRLEALRTVPGYAQAVAQVHRSGAAAFFNGMIAPLTPMTLQGVIWYQGESNVPAPAEYGPLFQTLIQDWRRQFGAEDLFFYFVQIAPYSYRKGTAAAELRAAQSSALQLKNTGMALSLDVGEPKNIHPPIKRTIGQRLAWQALAKTYGRKDVVADGPSLQAVRRENHQLHLTFRNLGGGLVARDGQALRCFELAGADGQFAPATAALVENKLVVVSPEVAEPQAVRFAWGEADIPNLVSRNGLPVAQFRATVK